MPCPIKVGIVNFPENLMELNLPVQVEEVEKEALSHNEAMGK